MVDMMTCMERVANTPIPRSYSIHLKQCVSLYLFSLPFTLIKDLGWGMIPLVTVVAFTLMGIEGIADEIEMPFGHDSADLPLGEHCVLTDCVHLPTTACLQNDTARTSGKRLSTPILSRCIGCH